MNTKKPSLLESIPGNLLTQSALTTFATLGATYAPFTAPLLPVLANSLATERHKKRVDAALQELNDQLTAQEDIVQNLSDNQYKLVNEIVLTILQTTEHEKLQYLRQVVINGIHYDELDSGDIAQITRILRDISASELAFVVKNFSYTRIKYAKTSDDARTLAVETQSIEGQLVAGLISLGILIPSENTYGDMGTYQFSPLNAKLLALLRP